MQSVLIIDDSEDIRSVIGKTLDYYGFSTRAARDGMAGVQAALDWHPDLILCDVRMPAMDGYKTLEAIRGMPALATTPFIFLTAAADKSEIRRGMCGGADDYLTKPCTAEELLEAVTARLAKQSELQCQIFKKAEKLRHEVVELLTKEIAAPLDGIAGLASSMIEEYPLLPPERVLARARQISESAQRVNQLTRSLG
jgi:two-component system sensor histidine kinase/response regulator